MPKGARRAKGSKAGPQSRKDQNYSESNMGSDDDSNIDNQSVFSASSSNRLDGYGSDNEQSHFNGIENGEAADDGYYDDFEEKLIEAIDQTSDKSAKTRQLALEAIRKAFTSRYMFDFIADRKVTIMDILERCLKRGKGEEQGAAATLAAIVIATLGESDDTDALFKEIETHLITTVNDATVPASTRARCATTLGLCCFVAGNGAETIESIMEVLLSIFSASFFKGNGAVPSHNPQITALHSSALLAWSLLCTVLHNSVVLALTEKHVKRIIELLESSDVELRIAAGETIAVLHEVSREVDEYFEVDDADKLYEKLRNLATDSQKFRAKKDRRVQRSSFRDILKCVEEGERPYISVKFGKERLILDSWCKKRQYDAFCHVLGSGMNLHLSENDLLRDIFGLGAPLSLDKGVQKISKFERHMGNLAASKARTRVRGKLRDKRADIII